MFQISAHAKYIHFHESLRYSFIKKICMTFINNTHFEAYTYLGSYNIGQIWICPTTTIYYVVFFDHVD